MNFFYNTFLLLLAQEGELVNQGNSWSILTMLGQFFFLIIILLIVLLLVYYLSRFMNSVKYTANKNSNLKIIETISVGYQSSLQIIQVVDKTILIGVTKEKVQYICDVDKDSINMDINKIELPDSFQKYLNHFINKKDDATEK